MLADVNAPAGGTVDSVPAHPFHGDSAIANSGSAGGLLDFIDQQGPAAPSTQQQSYKIRRRSGRVFGPYDEQTILQMLQRQELAGNEDASVDEVKWLPLSKIPVFAEEIQALMAAALGSLGSGAPAAPAPPTSGSDADLPGLPGMDLPGLPQQSAGLADLPGLPNQGGGHTDLPGLPGADLPGLPGVDLPGIPGSDLPQPYSPGQPAPDTGTPGGDLMAELGMSYSNQGGAALDDPLAAPLAPDDPLAADLSGPADAPQEKRRAGPTLAGQRRAAKRSRMVSIALVAGAGVLVIAAAGVFLGLVTDYGWFGHKLVMSIISPAEKPKPPPEKPKAPEIPVTDVPVEELLARDSYVSYTQAARVLSAGQGKPERALELAWVYARLALLDGDTTVVAAGRAALRSAGELAKKPLGVATKAIFDIVDGNCKSAAASLMPKADFKPPKKSEAEESEFLAVAGLALACSDRGQRQEAEAFVDSALVANPSNTFAMWCQAQLASKRRDYETAAGYYQKIVDLRPDNARAALLLGEALAHLRGRNNDALDLLNQALKQGGEALAPWQLGAAHLGVARVQTRAYAFDVAEDAAGKALAAASDHADTLRELGDFALEIFAYDIARKAFERLGVLSGQDRSSTIGLAKGLVGTGETLPAYDLMERAVKENPNDYQLTYWLGWVHMQMAKEDEAYKMFKKSYQDNPRETQAIEAIVAHHLRHGAIEKAQKFLLNSREKVLAEKQGPLDLSQAEIHYHLHKLKPALASLQKAKERDFESPRAQLLEGLIWLEMRKVSKGAEIINRLYKENPRDPQRIAHKGLSLLYQDKPKVAVAEFQKAIERDPQNAQFQIMLAKAYLALDDNNKALEALKAASELSPNNPEIYYYQGIATRPEDTKKALELIKRAETMAPQVARYSLEMGRTYVLQGAFLDAIDYIKAATRKDPNMAQAYYELGRAHVELVRYNDARDDFVHALRLDPEMIEANLAIGNTLAKQGDYEGAMKSYAAAIKGDPSLFEAYCKIGEVQKNNGKLKEAESSLQRCLKGNPFHKEAHKYLGYVYKDLRKGSKAIEQFELHLKQNPDDPEANLVSDDLEALKR